MRIGGITPPVVGTGAPEVRYVTLYPMQFVIPWKFIILAPLREAMVHISDPTQSWGMPLYECLSHKYRLFRIPFKSRLAQ